MRLIIFSDSHGNTDDMSVAVKEERPDMIIHLGDLESDAMDLRREFPNIPMYNVFGNCDIVPLGIDKFILPIEERAIFAAHGHRYGVKTGYDHIINTAMSAGADIVLFGHTHIPYEADYDGVIVINTGSVGSGSRTYEILTINGKDVSYEKKYVTDFYKNPTAF